MQIKLSKNDVLLKIIDYYKEVSPNAINIISTDTYFKKAQTLLKKLNLISKSNLSIRKSTSKPMNSKREILSNTYKATPYHLTPEGKKYLFNTFPNDYANYENPDLRKNNNNKTLNIMRKSNIEIMTLSIGAYKLENNIEHINNISEASRNLLEKELNKLSNKSPDSVADTLGTEYNPIDKSKIISQGISDEELRPILYREMKDNCVYISVNEIRKNVRPISKEDVNHDNYIGLSAVLLTENKLFSLYSAIDGYLSLTQKGEANRFTQIASHLASKYAIRTPAIEMAELKPSGIIVCETLKDIRNLYINKFNHKTEFNEVFLQANVVPMDKNGQIMLQRIVYYPQYEKTIAKEIVEKNGYKYNHETNRYMFPIKNTKDKYVLVGFNFNIDIFIEILKRAKENKSGYNDFEILCFPWQKDLYQEILTHYGLTGVAIKNIKEDVADDLTGFKVRKIMKGEEIFNILNLGTYENKQTKTKEKQNTSYIIL